MSSRFSPLRSLAVVLGAAALAGCGPSPDEVCAHLGELVTKEAAGNAEALASMQKAANLDSCPATMEMKKDMLGLPKWKAKASCVVKASTLAEADKCP